MVDTISKEHQKKIMNIMKRNFISEITIPLKGPFDEDLNFHWFSISANSLNNDNKDFGKVYLITHQTNKKRRILIELVSFSTYSQEMLIRQIAETFKIEVESIEKLPAQNEMCDVDFSYFLINGELCKSLAMLSEEMINSINGRNFFIIKEKLEQCELSLNDLKNSEICDNISTSDEKPYTRESDIIAMIETQINENGIEDAFFIADLNQLSIQHKRWRNCLPRVQPFYAVKCNNDINLLKHLVSLGTCFDCASLEEIKTMINLGVSPDKIIYANPCKPIKHLKFAFENNVDLMTFDNEDELIKIKEFYPNARLVIRIHVDDSKSVCQLGVKFGVHQGQTLNLLEQAWKLGLNVVGVSFHVGSGCMDSSAYSDAIKRAKDVFEEAREIGYDMTLLDLGGGFPGYSQPGCIEFQEIARVINQSLELYFPPPTDNSLTEQTISIIAEPGRYYAASCFTLASCITSRRQIIQEDKYMYYINDGVYGSFNCLIFDHVEMPFPKLVKYDTYLNKNILSLEKEEEQYFESSVWGPTCDSMDCVSKSVKLPKLQTGDWLVFEKMGAYTLVASSKFNGIAKPKVYYLNSDLPIKPVMPLLDENRTDLLDVDFFS
jgi:ornithine decarboxylase